jgi:hypothetical protein
MGLSVSQMQEATKQSFNKILREKIAITELELTKCCDMLNAFIMSVSCDFDFKGIENVKTNNAVGYIFSYKDYSDFRIIVLLYTEHKNVQIRVVADKEAKGYIEKTTDEIVSHASEDVIKYLYIDDDYDSIDDVIKRKIKFIKETIEEHHDFIVKQKVEHAMTAETFANKVQDLMHPGDDYLFVDPISGEQANMWFYNKLIEKIKAHPLLWKWFFTV